jgi:hypothetical protein
MEETCAAPHLAHSRGTAVGFLMIARFTHDG